MILEPDGGVGDGWGWGEGEGGGPIDPVKPGPKGFSRLLLFERLGEGRCVMLLMLRFRLLVCLEL